MRRSAAALLARPPPLPAPPPPEGLEAVRAATAEEMRAVDDKLAAVRAAVSGGSILQLAGPGRVSAVHCGAGMRRSGSDPELRRLQSDSESSQDGAYAHAGVVADLSLNERLMRERWLQTRQSSCPLLMPAFAVSSADNPRTPTDSALAYGWSRHGHGSGGGGVRGGGVCGGPVAAAAPKQGPWRWRQLPPAPRALWPCQSVAATSFHAAPFRPASATLQVTSALRPLAASVSFPRLPYTSGGGGGGWRGGTVVTAASAAAAFIDGGEAVLQATDLCSSTTANCWPGQLSPMRAGPILTGRAVR